MNDIDITPWMEEQAHEIINEQCVLTPPVKTAILLGQELQVVPPTGVRKQNRHHWSFISARGEAATGVHAPLFQRQSFLFSGKILHHSGMMELQLLQRMPE